MTEEFWVLKRVYGSGMAPSHPRSIIAVEHQFTGRRNLIFGGVPEPRKRSTV